MKKFLVSALILSGLAGFGCAQKAAVAPSDTQQSQSAKQELKAGDDTRKTSEKVTEQQTATVETKNLTGQDASKGQEISGMFEDIHFDFDKYDITEAAKPTLKAIAANMTKNNNKMLIEGHCDERGTNEYNLGLGDKRAKATKDFLIASGVSSTRIETISYGEEKPLCTEQSEDCWTKNRRSHFLVIQGKK